MTHLRDNWSTYKSVWTQNLWTNCIGDEFYGVETFVRSLGLSVRVRLLIDLKVLSSEN